MMNIVQRLMQHNIVATIYLNFKLLPLRQAIKLPIEVFHKIRVANIQGRVILDTMSIRRGMLQIGCYGSEMFSHNEETILYLAGDWICKGTIAIGIGSCVRVENGACLTTGNNVVFGARNLIFCAKQITIKDEFLSSWNCSVMDTDRHDIKDLSKGEILNNPLDIFVGEHTWLGNSVSINKGTRLPKNSIVASHSLCNKDYSGFGEYCVYAGIPAKKILNNRKWIK